MTVQSSMEEPAQRFLRDPGPITVATLISGTGSNLRAIADAIDRDRCAARLVAVISDRRKASGLELARDRNIPTEVVSPKDYPNRTTWDVALADAVAAYSPDLVVLAGFMRIVGQPLIDRFPRRMLNVHPSLLPAFPGADGPRQALASGARISGCTIHLVDAGVDTGPIVAQAAVPVLPDDDTAQLHARIQRAEHSLFPAVIDAVAKGHIQLSPSVRHNRSLPFRETAQLTCPEFPSVDAAPPTPESSS